ncbi:hypothetical protein PRECH8_25040 [Insulibacter thermoxylanivorax]|uniref:Uncharacterized protein n=1 Tax=Insulibacter thermoxylanivorax TaxID=2749268 RepID=A0A916QGU8_9BACL|nr:DUF6602 domain-containing protein [Insulibacter thermoxylanivorax]GFR39208.1 hypothetical protein PRECH8_25040 [Insulibacter thermoxylanivorax]
MQHMSLENSKEKALQSEKTKDCKPNKDVIVDIYKNYRYIESSIVNQLYMRVAVHSGMTGFAREDVWSQLFEMIIPKKFVIEHSVFIIDSRGNISKEVDLAIIDETYTPYIFRYGRLKFIPIEAVAVVVECKSKSIDENDISCWIEAITKLKTANNSIARMARNISVDAPRTQQSTRPIRILCTLAPNVKDEIAEKFDFVLFAGQRKAENSDEELGYIDVKVNGKKSLKEWFLELNFHDVKTPKDVLEDNEVKLLSKISLSDFEVYDANQESIPLLSFNFQLNQLLMLINNPIPFPHRDYAGLFKKKYVVAISIDKVQAFLYHMLQAQVQEHQLDSGSLSDIVQSSNLISEQLYKDIGIKEYEGEFSGHIRDELLKSSGLCIFTTTLDREEIIKRLNRLFKRYYKQSSGQLLMKYVCFEMNVREEGDKLQAINKSKRLLKQQDCLNQIIEQNQKVLFQFNDQQEGTFHKKHDQEKQYSYFAPTINALYSEEEADNPNHFRIAVIKADLDGMGELFRNIQNYKVYNAVSDILNEYISLDYLHEKTQEFKKHDPNFKLYPLYMAGDDIFFAVPISKLTDAVEICGDILQKLNDEIISIKKRYDYRLPQLSMSVGIEVTFNREPIRYYHERVQHQVDSAKRAPVLRKDGKVVRANCMKISINDHVFYLCRKIKGADKKFPLWDSFSRDIRKLKGAIQQGFAANHFLYGLLKKVEDQTIYNDAIKFSNTVLYHLLPKHLTGENSKLREFELLVIDMLLNQLIINRNQFNKRTKIGRNNQRGNKKKQDWILCFAETQKKQLIRYVRLLLLFSDPRFYRSDEKEVKEDFTKHLSRVKRNLFRLTTQFIYERSLNRLLKEVSEDVPALRGIFVRAESYELPNGYRKPIYRTLLITNSMFYRFKQLDKQHLDVVADMLEDYNGKTQEEVIQLEEERRKQKKAPPGLYFDKQAFLKIAKRTNLWTEDYIDSLFIFYRYHELSRQFRAIYPKPEANKSGGKQK